MNLEKIRNFAILSHVDHGKSTLADRFLELTKTISSKKMRPQFLDMMDLERERGITIKLQPCRMIYRADSGPEYILNLVDTPGHIDFSYEVSRSLAAVEGAILLVDAAKGIQAQTIHNLYLAKKQKLVIIPVINKIDLQQARVEQTVTELTTLLKISRDEVIKISAKNSTNIEEVLKAVIKNIPPPEQKLTGMASRSIFRALIFDSKYDSYKGVIAYVRVVDGEISSGEKINLLGTETEAEIKEIGFFTPKLSHQDKLSAGEIGYIATGIKEPGKVRAGDTITNFQFKVEPLPGYKESKPMVFASIYPEDPDNFDLLKESLSKLKLNDPSLIFEPETKEGLGRGFRCGFLGTLHAEIVSERLRREFGLEMIISVPSVVYKVVIQKDKEKFVYSANEWPEPTEIKKMEEPWVSLEILTPAEYLGKVSELLKSIKGNYVKTEYLGKERVLLFYQTPLREIIINFYDKLKSISQGYASMNYKTIGFKEADLVKMEVLIAGIKEEVFSRIVPKDKSLQEGRTLIKKLKEILPHQQFSVALQAAVGGKIIARETISSRRKDVTAPLYGGDVTRKRKLLEKQKKGKKKLKEKGRVRIPPSTFLEIFRG